MDAESGRTPVATPRVNFQSKYPNLATESRDGEYLSRFLVFVFFLAIWAVEIALLALADNQICDVQLRPVAIALTFLTFWFLFYLAWKALMPDVAIRQCIPEPWKNSHMHFGWVLIVVVLALNILQIVLLAESRSCITTNETLFGLSIAMVVVYTIGCFVMAGFLVMWIKEGRFA